MVKPGGRATALREAGGARSDLVDEVLRIARDHLGMKAAFVSEFVGDTQILRWVEGDTVAVPIAENDEIPLDDSYCRRVVEQDIDGIIPDARHDPRVAGLPATERHRIGSYVGVPIVLSDGTLFGTLCCMSDQPDPELHERDLHYIEVLAQLVGRELERRDMERREWTAQLETAGVEALLAALSARDGYTGEHSEAVVDLAEAVGRRIGLDEPGLRQVRQVALLHDIGKIGVPDSVLRKPGPLDATEWRLMREHPVIGARIVEAIPGLKNLAPAIRAEHERWDGRGYPDGLSGEDIPRTSRIILVCDAFHAMASRRPYRNAMSQTEALAEIRAHRGMQFAPEEVDALLEVVGETDGLIVTGESPDGHRMLRVLLVDDDPSIRQLLRFSLESHGRFHVIGEAGDGAEALTLVSSEDPDAVVLDLSMPVMDGLEVIPHIEEVSPRTRVLVFSASDEGRVFQQAQALGADLCIGKGTPLTAVSDALIDLCGTD